MHRARGGQVPPSSGQERTCPFLVTTFDKLLSFLVLKKRPLWWASLYSRALTSICVDEVPAPRSRPSTVRQGNGGLLLQHLPFRDGNDFCNNAWRYTLLSPRLFQHALPCHLGAILAVAPAAAEAGTLFCKAPSQAGRGSAHSLSAPPPGWVRAGILCASSIHALHAHTSGPSVRFPRSPRAPHLALSVSCTPACRILYTCGRRRCQPIALPFFPPHPRAQAPHHSSLSRIWHYPRLSRHTRSRRA
jgi:hypothetical protein